MLRKYFLGIVFLAQFQLMFFCCKAQVLDTTKVAYFAQQLLDSTTSIGLFESGSIELHTMKNGVLPELDKNYIEVMQKNNLVKLFTIEAIKGEFDSLVFVQASMISTRNTRVEFFPFSGNKMILCLKNCFQNGQKQDWLKKTTNADKISFINPLSAYYVSDFTKGTLYLKWAFKDEPGNDLQFVNDTFLYDLKKIIRVLSSVGYDNSTPFYKKELEPLQNEISSAYAKALLKELLKLAR